MMSSMSGGLIDEEEVRFHFVLAMINMKISAS